MLLLRRTMGGRPTDEWEEGGCVGENADNVNGLGKAGVLR